MKRFKVPALFMVLILALTTAGCGGGGGETDGVYNVRMAGSVLGGVFYTQSSTLAGYVNNRLEGIRATVEVTSGGHENVVIVDHESNAMGIGNAMAIYQATKGEEPFQEAAENLTAMAWSNPNPVHIVVKESSDIQTIQDLKGKVVNPGAKGSGTESSLPPLLEAIGMSYDDFARVEYLAFAEAADAMRNGLVDAIFWTGGYPASSIEELATTEGIRLIPLQPDEIEAIEAKLPYYYTTEIPAVYAGVDKVTPTVALGSVWLVNKNIPEDVVYDMTKLTAENLDELAKGHSAFRQWEFKRTVESLVPLHPGAAKYYDEQGW